MTLGISTGGNSPSAAGARGRRGERGFTLIEVLMALLILLIGVAGVLTLQVTSMRATSFSRHATEAAVVGEDKLEAFRTISPDTLSSGSDEVDSRGVLTSDGPYTRTWNVADMGSHLDVVVEVGWLERGAEPYTVTLATKVRR